MFVASGRGSPTGWCVRRKSRGWSTTWVSTTPRGIRLDTSGLSVLVRCDAASPTRWSMRTLPYVTTVGSKQSRKLCAVASGSDRFAQLGELVCDPRRERVDVGDDVGAGDEPEADRVCAAHHRDVEADAVVRRADGKEPEQARTTEIEGHGRAGHVRDQQVHDGRRSGCEMEPDVQARGRRDHDRARSLEPAQERVGPDRVL